MKRNYFKSLYERAEAAISCFSSIGGFLQYIYSVLVAKESSEDPIKVFKSWVLYGCGYLLLL